MIAAIDIAEVAVALEDGNTAGSDHPFTRAGLGDAPFRLVHETAEFKARRLSGGFGECEACGKMGISRPFYVRSACGKISMVGSDCIEKIAHADPGLARVVDAEVRKHRRVLARNAKVRKATSVHESLIRLDELAVRDALATRPHPKFADRSLLDWAIWMANNAGAKGKGDVAKVIDGLSI